MPEKKLSQEFEEGLKHFYSCINFGQSTLDAEAICFMNETPGKVLESLKKSEQKQE